jgi:hypothetical protein
MKMKKIVIISFLISVIIVLATITPAVCAENLNIEKKVTIKTTFYQFLNKKEIVTEVSKDEVEEIKENLEHLQQALIKGDKQLIEKYELYLINKGIFDKNDKIFSKKNIMSSLSKRYNSMKIENPSSLVDENRMCLVNARGKGNLTFMFDEAFESLVFAGAMLILLCALLPPLIPILAPPALLLILGGIAGYFLAHLRPFRILNPTLNMSLKTGNCSINGINGSQQYTAPLDASFYWISGITVNFYTKDPDIVLLIFALRSEVL